MKSRPIVGYIFLGLGWRYLQDINAGTLIHGDGFVLFNIKTVLQRLEEFNLQVTLRSATELYELRDEFEKLPLEAILTVEQAGKLSQAMRDLQRVVQAEGSGNFSYIATDKRLDITKLLGHAEKLFAPNVFEKLPDVAKYDFLEAGYCIAFERSTAGAFHLLRGTEDVLRSFYCQIIKRNRVNPLLWGPIVSALRKRRHSPSPESLNNLDNIRISFRNPTQHPEKIYDIQEVQDLFALCVDVVNRMVRSETWNSNS